MAVKLSRRSFLKLCTLAIGGMAFRPLESPSGRSFSDQLLRVTIHSVSVYRQPSDKSPIIRQLYRDELVSFYYELVSPDGPGYNPRWYRVWGGYVHSAYMQKVQFRPNLILSSPPEKPILAEVTVPFTQSMRRSSHETWKPLYRLYQGSTHWIVGIDPGPSGEPWYRLLDELLEVEYHLPAPHLRPIPPSEVAPLSPDVPPQKKRIEVSLPAQTLVAFEDGHPVFQTRISSGITTPNLPPGSIPTETPRGEFNVQNKMPSKHMGDGNLTDDYEAYELVGVPWTSFFEPETGVAFHGTWWHDNFGIPMSHGCINMRIPEAKWIYRWTTPIADPEKVNTIGYGTYVIVD